MPETQKLDIPNIEWLIRLSDEDYAKLKERYADFILFVMVQLMKSAAVIEYLKEDDESMTRFSLQMADTLYKQGLLSKKNYNEIKKEAKTIGD